MFALLIVRKKLHSCLVRSGEMSEILEIPPYAPRLEGRRVPYYLKGITRRYKSVCDHWVTRSIWYVVSLISMVSHLKYYVPH